MPGIAQSVQRVFLPVGLLIDTIGFFRSSHLSQQLGTLKLQTDVFVGGRCFRDLCQAFVLLQGQFILPDSLIVLGQYIVVDTTQVEIIQLFVDFPGFVQFGFSLFGITGLDVIVGIARTYEKVECRIRVIGIQVFKLLQIDAYLVHVRGLNQGQDEFRKNLLFEDFATRYFVKQLQSFFIRFDGGFLHVGIQVGIPNGTAGKSYTDGGIQFFGFLIHPAGMVDGHIHVSS